jgi:hypothetical protein
LDKERVLVRFPLGSTIDQAVDELLAYRRFGKLAYGKFNGVFLFSDTVSLDVAYQHITGMTKAEYAAKYESKEDGN